MLIGGGALFAWRTHAGTVETPAGAIRLAVLPFDNLGDSADAYFADGVTDAVRGKLTSLPGLEVIGSVTSSQYRHTTKSPRDIAQELGVRYLLLGKVRWAKGPGGTSRVQVSPELMDVATAADKWAQPFDAPLTDVFQVQGDIASKVANALQVALTPAAQQTLTARPTNDLSAYDAYLRALDIGASGNAPAVLRRAIVADREATSRDSTFALAWSHMGVMYTLLYTNSVPEPAIADSADVATARALALAPDLPDVHAARSLYYAFVHDDNARGLAEADAALARSPNNTDLLRRTAQIQSSLGQWSEALARAQQAQRLDPQNPRNLTLLCELERWQRMYTEAALSCGRRLAQAPENLAVIEGSAMLALEQGDLTGAQRIIHSVPPTVDQAALVAYLGNFWDLYWVLDSAQQARLLTLGPDAFDGDKATQASVRAQLYWLRGDRARARVYADTARIGFEAQLRAIPNDEQRHMFLALALAYLGRSSEAVREAERSIALKPIAKDARTGTYDTYLLARVYLVAGQPEKAIDILQQLLSIPFYVSRGWLKVDPTWSALRGDPRFEQLIAGA